MSLNISKSIAAQAMETVDKVGHLSEFAMAFTAIEDLMRPADSGTQYDLRSVGRDELTSLIGVVNNAFKRELEDVSKTAMAAAHAVSALGREAQ